MKSIVYMLLGVQIRGAHTFDDRLPQGQGRFENGVLINQEGLAAKSSCKCPKDGLDRTDKLYPVRSSAKVGAGVDKPACRAPEP